MNKEAEKNGEAGSLRRDTHSRGRERREDPATQKIKTGRPKKYPKLMRVRLTVEEHKRVYQGAKSAGMSMSRYLIERALANNRSLVQDSATIEATTATAVQREWAICEVARVGNNLNQIARQLNSQRGGITSEKIERALTAVAEKLTELRRLWRREGSD